MLSQLYNSLASFFNGIFKLFEGQRDVRILMVGLDGAGKTSILYKLKLGEVVSTIPTIGFNVEIVTHSNLNCVVWDIGGQNKIRHYYNNTNAIILVVDSNDRKRMDEVKEEINILFIQDELKDTTLLVLANKQDMQGAMSAAEIADALDLNSIKNRKWSIQPCSSYTSQGSYEGFDWISNVLKNKK